MSRNQQQTIPRLISPQAGHHQRLRLLAQENLGTDHGCFFPK